jgi:uncharacterized membrane protein YphA (DoxX/SURF4 family)
LAAVWLISGSIKASNSAQTYLAVQAYDVLPADAVRPVATIVPLLELTLGVFLLVGLGTRIFAAISAVVLLVFIAAIAQSWARGLSIDCGCFGGGGQVSSDQTEYPREIAVDVGYLILAGWLLIRSSTLVSVDRWLGWGQKKSSTPHDENSDEAKPEGT